VLWAVVHHVAATIHGRSRILLPDGGQLAIRAGYPSEDRLDDKARAAAEWAWSHAEPAGRGSTTLPTSEWLFLPLKTRRGPVGVLGIQIEGSDRLLSPEDRRLLGTLADQAAVAIERTNLVSDIENARLATETERLRSALLSSLSHDLRTPLASILGAASSLISYEGSLNASDRLDLAQTIQDEAERLNRFVQNLLDMTRLGSGKLKPRTDWVDLRDIVGSAVERAAKLLRRRPVRVERSRHAAAVPGRDADGAGDLQPDRQRLQIFTSRHTGHGLDRVPRRPRHHRGLRPGTRHSRGGPRTDLRHVLPGRRRRQPRRRDRAGSGDLPRHRRGPWRPRLRPTRHERCRHLHRHPTAVGRGRPACHAAAGRSGRMILAKP
jgi:hypothetical protein